MCSRRTAVVMCGPREMFFELPRPVSVLVRVEESAIQIKKFPTGGKFSLEVLKKIASKTKRFPQPAHCAHG